MTETVELLETGDESDSRNALLEKLGIKGEVNYLPEDQAPAVDLGTLRALIDHALSDDESLAVCRLMASFRSWNDGYAKLLSERAGTSEHEEGEQVG